MNAANFGHGELLVVDDVAENRNLLTRYFGARGFRIAEADCGLTALSMIKQRHFAAVLLDIVMPGMDGIEVLKRIRASHTPADLPVIMVSGQSAHNDLKLALDLGANDYFTKPIDLAAALTKLQYVLGALPHKQANPQVQETARADHVGKTNALPPDRRELRRRPRLQLQCTAWILVDKRVAPIKCTIADVSALGTRIVLQGEQDLPDHFILLIAENGGARRNCRLVWRTGSNVGIEFISGVEFFRASGSILCITA
jgi:CheY-like chemotaxis protein